jgi:hypothetical protein
VGLVGGAWWLSVDKGGIGVPAEGVGSGGRVVTPVGDGVIGGRGIVVGAPEGAGVGARVVDGARGVGGAPGRAVVGGAAVVMRGLDVVGDAGGPAVVGAPDDGVLGDDVLGALVAVVVNPGGASVSGGVFVVGNSVPEVASGGVGTGVGIGVPGAFVVDSDGGGAEVRVSCGGDGGASVVVSGSGAEVVDSSGGGAAVVVSGVGGTGVVVAWGDGASVVVVAGKVVVVVSESGGAGVVVAGGGATVVDVVASQPPESFGMQRGFVVPPPQQVSISRTQCLTVPSALLQFPQFWHTVLSKIVPPPALLRKMNWSSRVAGLRFHAADMVFESGKKFCPSMNSAKLTPSGQRPFVPG